MANRLSFDQQAEIIALLTEGCSLRAISRLTGTHRDTIGRLAIRVGGGCDRLHDQLFQNLHVNLLELDEIWSFVGAKEKTVKRKAARVAEQTGADLSIDAERGDQYTFVGLGASTKAIISYATGKRTTGATQAFVADLRSRITNRPQISTDGFMPYIEAIEAAFGNDVDYGMVIKQYGSDGQTSQESPMAASRRYSPGRVTGIKKRVLRGMPDRSRISTSYVERQNLTLRMHMRRFTRLTNGFSKKLRNHKAALALHIAWYNLCRVHETLRVTPAMEIGVADHVWSIGELLDAALGDAPVAGPASVGGRPVLRVIDGGLR